MSQKIIQLWDTTPPDYKEGEIPKLTYFPAAIKRGRGAVLIFAGGGYSMRCDYEGSGYAHFINAQGLDAFVLDYRVAPARFPSPLLDARRAMRIIRSNAEFFGINPQKIAVMGSSAGGHLAALISTYRGIIAGEGYDELDKLDPTPNAQILCYPVTAHENNPKSYQNLLGESFEAKHDMVDPVKIADTNTPVAFIWHTANDSAVSVKGSYTYAAKLKELGIPTEMHIYPDGPHGLALCDDAERGALSPHVATWKRLLVSWLELNGYYDK